MHSLVWRLGRHAPKGHVAKNIHFPEISRTIADVLGSRFGSRAARVGVAYMRRAEKSSIVARGRDEPDIPVTRGLFLISHPLVVVHGAVRKVRHRQYGMGWDEMR